MRIVAIVILTLGICIITLALCKAAKEGDEGIERVFYKAK